MDPKRFYGVFTFLVIPVLIVAAVVGTIAIMINIWVAKESEEPGPYKQEESASIITSTAPASHKGRAAQVAPAVAPLPGITFIKSRPMPQRAPENITSETTAKKVSVGKKGRGISTSSKNPTAEELKDMEKRGIALY